MSADTLAASNPVVNDETTNNTEYAEYPEQTDSSSANGVLHSNGAEENNGSSEPVVEGQSESSKDAYDPNNPSAFNKSDLEPEVFRKVFIGGLSYKTDEQTFREYFSKYGNIEVKRSNFNVKPVFFLRNIGLYYHA